MATGQPPKKLTRAGKNNSSGLPNNWLVPNPGPSRGSSLPPSGRSTVETDDLPSNRQISRRTSAESDEPLKNACRPEVSSAQVSTITRSTEAKRSMLPRVWVGPAWARTSTPQFPTRARPRVLPTWESSLKVGFREAQSGVYTRQYPKLPTSRATIAFGGRHILQRHSSVDERPFDVTSKRHGAIRLKNLTKPYPEKQTSDSIQTLRAKASADLVVNRGWAGGRRQLRENHFSNPPSRCSRSGAPNLVSRGPLCLRSDPRCKVPGCLDLYLTGTTVITVGAQCLCTFIFCNSPRSPLKRAVLVV